MCVCECTNAQKSPEKGQRQCNPLHTLTYLFSLCLFQNKNISPCANSVIYIYIKIQL